MKGGTRHGGLRVTDLQSRPIEFLDFTSVTLDVSGHCHYATAIRGHALLGSALHVMLFFENLI
jgi:hypothetical protein